LVRIEFSSIYYYSVTPGGGAASRARRAAMMSQWPGPAAPTLAEAAVAKGSSLQTSLSQLYPTTRTSITAMSAGLEARRVRARRLTWRDAHR